MNVIKIPDYGQHLLFAGTTSSGKSQLALELLKQFNSYFVIDTQDSLILPGSTKITSPKMLKQKLQFFKKIRYVPSGEYRTKAYWNYIFKTLSDSSSKKKPRPRIIYIDEIYHLGYGVNFPNWIPIMATTGRQRKLSLWISSQRPSMIPIPTMSECTRFYLFYISYDEDITKMSKFVRKDKRGLIQELNQIELDYSFIEVDRIRGEWRKMPKIKL